MRRYFDNIQISAVEKYFVKLQHSNAILKCRIEKLDKNQSNAIQKLHSVSRTIELNIKNYPRS